jgi:hypothetical protein
MELTEFLKYVLLIIASIVIIGVVYVAVCAFLDEFKSE